MFDELIFIAFGFVLAYTPKIAEYLKNKWK
jgi:hypothetical protein